MPLEPRDYYTLSTMVLDGDVEIPKLAYRKAPLEFACADLLKREEILEETLEETCHPQ